MRAVRLRSVVTVIAARRTWRTGQVGGARRPGLARRPWADRRIFRQEIVSSLPPSRRPSVTPGAFCDFLAPALAGCVLRRSDHCRCRRKFLSDRRHKPVVTSSGRWRGRCSAGCWGSRIACRRRSTDWSRAANPDAGQGRIFGAARRTVRHDLPCHRRFARSSRSPQRRTPASRAFSATRGHRGPAHLLRRRASP